MVDMAATQASALQLHKLASPDDPLLPTVLALSNAIFNTDPSEDATHGSLAEWQARLARPSSFIVYLAPPTEAAPQPVAFLFMIPRITNPPLRNGVIESTHIWLAGVLPEWRRGGCLATMVAALDDIDPLTVCTYPSRFPNMWAWLNRRGWVQERELGEGKVMFSRPR